jgi:hypothetical protein
MPDGAVAPPWGPGMAVYVKCDPDFHQLFCNCRGFRSVLGQQIEIPHMPVGSIYALAVDR